MLRKVWYSEMKKYKRFLCFFGVLLMVMMFPAPSAHAEEENDGDGDKTGAPYFYVETDDTSVIASP